MTRSTDRESRTINGTGVFKRENRHGVPKDHVQVDIGTTVVECPRRLRNPITERTEDLTQLSDNGYLKPFLALEYASNSPDHIDLGSSPILSFGPDRWEWQEQDGRLVVQKREAETRFEEMVIGDE